MSDQKPAETPTAAFESSGHYATGSKTHPETRGTAADSGPGTELSATGPGQPNTEAAEPATATNPQRTGDRPAARQHTRIGAAWAAVAVAVVVLVVLLVFILQNLHQVSVRFFAAQGRFPVGVLVLFSAAGGALVVIVLGAARMIQLRWLARRDRRVVQQRPSG